ncbi:hypothetical protein E2C01_065422 [Portunus trituberculatus]|uniref:Uncharacterized protein n=1 Tax=Portunus trituberculatus TaxID=210409 RepID=A0A5B7HEJ1_PORTR|nr:hypothetical protein [Portunus trituberculatus]
MHGIRFADVRRRVVQVAGAFISTLHRCSEHHTSNDQFTVVMARRGAEWRAKHTLPRGRDASASNIFFLLNPFFLLRGGDHLGRGPSGWRQVSSLSSLTSGQPHLSSF